LIFITGWGHKSPFSFILSHFTPFVKMIFKQIGRIIEKIYWQYSS